LSFREQREILFYRSGFLPLVEMTRDGVEMSGGVGRNGRRVWSEMKIEAYENNSCGGKSKGLPR